MIDYIIANKEWIFSGFGGSVVLLVCGWLFKRDKQQSAAAAPPLPSTEVIKAPAPDPQSTSQQSEVAGMVKRFNQLLQLMNQNKTWNPYTIAGLAQRMKLNSVGELESVFSGAREPDFVFIDQFCHCFGVNREWLIEGKSAPFRNAVGTHYDPLSYLEEIERDKPERIWFIRSQSEVGEVFILLKLTDWRYKVLPRVWHISDHVGAGGRSQIFGFYRLIQELLKKEYYLKCGGRILPESDFDNLLNGTVFAGAIIDVNLQENPWWDDFMDITHKYPIAKNYQANYGKGFIAAQLTVRWQLEELAKRESVVTQKDEI